jgi:malonate decarboxylase epsilon subunit
MALNLALSPRKTLMSVAFLFPGQGSQSVGMTERLPHDSVVRETIEEASSILKCDLRKLDTEEALRHTETAQILLFVCGVAVARLLEARGARADFSAGHSVGAFGAAVLAGVLDMTTGTQLVAERGRAMAAFPGEYGMGAITGVPGSVVDDLLNQVRVRGIRVFIANWNAPDQTVISGTRTAVEQVLGLAMGRGARKAVMLNIAVPSHTEFMSGVAQHLAEFASATEPNRPRIPCVSNSTARLLYDGHIILDDLVWSVSRPVRWHDATVTMYEAGARVFLEMPPGEVLTRLAASAFRDSRCLAIEDSDIDSAVAVTRS